MWMHSTYPLSSLFTHYSSMKLEGIHLLTMKLSVVINHACFMPMGSSSNLKFRQILFVDIVNLTKLEHTKL